MYISFLHMTDWALKELFIQAVGATLKKIFGVAGEIVVDVLETSIDLMDFAPLPGLQTISKTFVSSWRAVQQVSVCLNPSTRVHILSISNYHSDEPLGLPSSRPNM